MDLLTCAVLNNVEWCGLVSGRGVSDDATGVWLVTGSPSPLFPDAVTLRRGVSADQLASVLSDRQTCSVKDSFADVDLGPHGFRPLFTGRWIGCAAPPGGSTGWSQVADLVWLKSWCVAAGTSRGCRSSATSTVRTSTLRSAPGSPSWARCGSGSGNRQLDRYYRGSIKV